ncbi:MAG: ParB/RepB/Spo0J family partition protein [Lachnospiraceae bacterium]|nr:ParB/RepB/Spo0J family partition protein [Lachnospiraceae bacterium]
MVKKGLGKGLDALFGEEKTTNAQQKYTQAPDRKSLASGEVMIKVSSIVPNANQPRKTFNQDAMEELIASVKQHGVVTPLIVKRVGEKYEIIAGERRWRASQAAGIKEVPVVVRDYDDQSTAEIALIENLQREDLNAIEEALAYQELIENYHLSQEEVAGRVSKSRSAITNALRLLKLDADVRDMVADGAISGGHARAILGLSDAAMQKKLAEEIVQNRLSVRETEKKVKSLSRNNAPKTPKAGPDSKYDIFYKEYESKMQDMLGTKVHINRKDNSKGRIEIDYYSQAELERLMDLFKTIREQ